MYAGGVCVDLGFIAAEEGYYVKKYDYSFVSFFHTDFTLLLYYVNGKKYQERMIL